MRRIQITWIEMATGNRAPFLRQDETITTQCTPEMCRIVAIRSAEMHGIDTNRYTAIAREEPQ